MHAPVIVFLMGSSFLVASSIVYDIDGQLYRRMTTNCSVPAQYKTCHNTVATYKIGVCAAFLHLFTTESKFRKLPALPQIFLRDLGFGRVRPAATLQFRLVCSPAWRVTLTCCLCDESMFAIHTRTIKVSQTNPSILSRLCGEAVPSLWRPYIKFWSSLAGEGKSQLE